MSDFSDHIVSIVNFGGSVFVRGVMDSLSIHKTLKFLVNNNAIATDVAQCIAANGVLLLGSLFLFHKAVVPLTSFVQEEIKESDIDESAFLNSIADMSVWSFYHILWILPVWLLCYACSYGWYQSIALASYQMQCGDPKDIGVQKSVTTSVYATVVWGLAYLQIILFDKLLPLFLNGIISIVLLVLKSMDSPLGGGFFSTIVGATVVGPLRLVVVACQAFGVVLMGVMYGWYGFDMIWISDGLEPIVRYSILERHWLYFLGFGMPYVILVKSTSFFVGYGLYLMLFPFTILISAVSSYKDATEEALAYHHSSAPSAGGSGGDVSGSDRKETKEHPVRPLRMFRLARYVADWSIKLVDSKLRPKRGNRGVVSASSSSRKND
jgi:hypothetical protein